MPTVVALGCEEAVGLLRVLAGLRQNSAYSVEKLR
jgi:hypothetical protein